MDKDDFARCYDIFLTLRSEKYLQQIRAQHKARKESERRYRETWQSTYEQYSSGSYSIPSVSTCGEEERAERIDSFEAGKVEGWGTLFTNSMIPLDCEHFMEDDGETVELSRGWWSVMLELTRKKNGFGGSCAKLNYRCQQRAKDSTNHARDGLKLARDKLRWEPPFPVAPMDFPHVIPDRPRYMHRSTYYRYLARYMWYQEKYQQDSMREMLAILRRWG